MRSYNPILELKKKKKEKENHLLCQDLKETFIS